MMVFKGSFLTGYCAKQRYAFIETFISFVSDNRSLTDRMLLYGWKYTLRVVNSSRPGFVTSGLISSTV